MGTVGANAFHWHGMAEWLVELVALRKRAAAVKKVYQFRHPFVSQQSYTIAFCACVPGREMEDTESAKQVLYTTARLFVCGPSQRTFPGNYPLWRGRRGRSAKRARYRFRECR